MPAGFSKRDRARRVLARVARVGLDPSDRPAELLGGDLGGDARFRRRAFLRPADAAAEGDRRAGLLGEPDAVAQPLERGRSCRLLTPYSGANGSAPPPRMTIATGFFAATSARSSRTRSKLSAAGGCSISWVEAARRAGAGRQPQQRDAEDDHQPAEAAPRQQQARADQRQEQEGHRRQQQRGDHRLPRLDAERHEETVHGSFWSRARQRPRLCPSRRDPRVGVAKRHVRARALARIAGPRPVRARAARAARPCRRAGSAGGRAGATCGPARTPRRRARRR